MWVPLFLKSCPPMSVSPWSDPQRGITDTRQMARVEPPGRGFWWGPRTRGMAGSRGSEAPAVAGVAVSVGGNVRQVGSGWGLGCKDCPGGWTAVLFPSCSLSSRSSLPQCFDCCSFPERRLGHRNKGPDAQESRQFQTWTVFQIQLMCP